MIDVVNKLCACGTQMNFGLAIEDGGDGMVVACKVCKSPGMTNIRYSKLYAERLAAQVEAAENNPDVPSPKSKEEIDDLVKGNLSGQLLILDIEGNVLDPKLIQQYKDTPEASAYIYAYSALKDDTSSVSINAMRASAIAESDSALTYTGKTNTPILQMQDGTRLMKKVLLDHGWKIALFPLGDSDSTLDVHRFEKGLHIGGKHPQGNELWKKDGGKVGNFKRAVDGRGNKYGLAVQSNSAYTYYVAMIYNMEGVKGTRGLERIDDYEEEEDEDEEYYVNEEFEEEE